VAYKTIMTIVTSPELDKSALDPAIALCDRAEAHLEVVCLGIDHTQAGYYYAGASAVLMQETLERARAQVAAIEQAVKERMSGEVISWSCDAAVTQIAGLSFLVTRRALFTDLVVMPKPYGEFCGPEDEAAVEAALFDGKAPVLIIPHGVDINAAGKHVVVAWNQSAEALTAVRAAMPILQAADTVNIAVIDPPQHGPERSDPGGMLALMLDRHGVKAEISVLAKSMPRVSEVLARHVEDINADLVVMGAYGHSRFREAILGGATRNVLESTEVPVLMAH